MDYFAKGKTLDNTIHDIDYEYLRKMYRDNQREIRSAERLTASSYRGEYFYDDNSIPFYEAFEKEMLIRDQQTAGMQVQYPHGIMIRQPALRNYYRGENRVYEKSVPSLLRKLDTYRTEKEKALYRLVADMRIAEFKHLIDKFDHVKKWKYDANGNLRYGDVLYDLLAQHYGLETGWLDITSDFRVALFFATCFYDYEAKEWKPLSKAQIEEHPYGMLFHMPSWQRSTRWMRAVDYFATISNEVVETDEHGNPKRYKAYDYPPFKGIPENLIYPIGYQPFMRCSMQYGYGIYMRVSMPLQDDYVFEKLRFKHSEELSKRVYEMMEGGKKIYPHEGLRDADYIIDQIRSGTVFSEDAFQYALYRSQEYTLSDKEACRKDLESFRIEGKSIKIVPNHVYEISSGRRKKIDAQYANFSLENTYGIRIMRRGSPQKMQSMYEPWQLPEKENQPGVIDFKPRECVPDLENLWSWSAIASRATLIKARTPDF